MQLTQILTERANNPKRIGQRVQIIDYVLRKRDGTAEKAKVFAHTLNVSESRVSQLVSDMEAKLDLILKPKVPENR